MGEIGSLFAPTEDDIAALEGDLHESPAGDLFSAHANENVDIALSLCKTLRRRFDVVVANPPYMGSSSFNPFMSKWMKKNYPDVKSDLFAAFIVRIMDIAKDHGEVGIMSPFVWMFIGSYEKLRNKLIDEKTITSLIQLEYSGFAGATVPICTFTYHNSHIDGYKGGYVRLSDFVGASVQAPKALEAIHNPACGWFYRADATTFHDIPGSPIAYWASDAALRAYMYGKLVGNVSILKQGMKTADNERFLRLWFEPSFSLTACPNVGKSDQYDGSAWVPYLKGGDFRKWFGNYSHIVYWKNDGEDLKSFSKAILRHLAYAFNSGISWSVVSSGRLAMRVTPSGYMFDGAGSELFEEQVPINYVMAFFNSSVGAAFAGFMSPTLMFEVGQLSNYPLIYQSQLNARVCELVEENIGLSKSDWDSFETSWDFRRSAL